ncbi:mannitol dehydrogenase family protein [Falsihalocynthiibacter sp. BN13B15]
MQKLDLSALNSLSANVIVPQYSRGDLTAGIVHIGVGNFHRAHMAVYLDALFSTGRDHDWAIVGAGIKSFDADRRAALKEQDWLTTVVELAPESLTARVTGSMIDFCEVETEALLAQLCAPNIRIVSLTVTEGGYFVDAKTGLFDAKHPDILADAAAPKSPKTVFGILLLALQRRRAVGIDPFTILSCDNLPENGHVTSNTVLGLAEMIGADLKEWVQANVAFPNSMVDCITPATTDRERALVKEQFGIIDSAPVACEPFRQWVMEDNFPFGRPRLEHVGVTFVGNVTPYETMKLRILNAGHAAIAYPGALLGYEFVHEAMADEDIRAWLIHVMRTDVMPILPPIAGENFEDYLQMCVERFSNPRVGDTIDRLCLDGSNRQPKFVVPTIQEALAAGTSLKALALEVAFWCKYCADCPDLQDERAEVLRIAAQASRTDPSAFLKITSVFGDLAGEERFAIEFAAQIDQLWTLDVRDVIRGTI